MMLRRRYLDTAIDGSTLGCINMFLSSTVIRSPYTGLTVAGARVWPADVIKQFCIW